MPLTFDDYIAGKRKPVTFDAFMAKKADTGVVEPQVSGPDEVVPFTGPIQQPPREAKHPLDPLFDLMGFVKEKADIKIPGTERRLFEPIPNPESDPIISATNFIKGMIGLTPDIPEFLAKDLPEAVSGTLTPEDRLKPEDPTIRRMVEPMGRATIDVMNLAVMRQFQPEEYERFIKTERGEAIRKMEAEQLHEPALLPLILSGGLGKAAKLTGKIGKAPAPRLKAKPKGEPLEPILREVLDFEKPTERVPIVEEVLGVEKRPVAPKPKAEAAVDRFIERGIEKETKAARGQEILDIMEDRGITPKDVETQFWNETYPRMTAVEKAKADRIVKSYYEFTDPKIDIGKWGKEQAKAAMEDVTALSGAERGYTVTLAGLNERFATKPAPSPRGVKGPGKVKAERIRDDLPEAKPIIDEIDRIVAVAHKRMVEAKDPAIRGLRPTEMDWMTEVELKRVHELQLKIRSKTQGEAKADVARKRAERLAKAPERGAALNPFQEVATATSEMIQKAKAPPEITAGVKKAKEAMIEHDRQIRRSEFTSKQFEKVIKDNVSTTEREMLMVHAYEHKTTGPYWDKLSPLEKKITEWAAGEKAKLNQFIKDNQILETMPEQKGINHIFHHWIDPKTKQPYAAMYSKFSKGLPQAKQRVIPDYATGMQATPENPMGTGTGMKPATTNLGKLIGLEWESVMRAHQSRQMFKTLHHIGADPQTTIQLRTGKAPKPIRMIENWNKLQDQGLTEGHVRYDHWSLDKPITFKSGDRLVTIKGPVGIRQELHPFVRAYIENPNYGAYDRLNFMSKQFKLGGTLFHAVQLGIQEIANRRIPFKNIPRGLKARKNLEPDLKLLHQEGLELFKGYEDVGYRNKFFKGTTIFGKSGNVATYPIRMLRDFLFEVIQPGMKTSFALDKLRKLRPKMLKEGFTENQTARAAVKMADGHFSGEHYKRSMLETNRFVTNLFFSPKGRRLMQRLWLSFTWQREHALVAKDVGKSFMPQKMIRKLHLSEMSKAEKAEYRKYAVAAAVIISSADTYNYMATEAMDGEGKHLWQNPKDKGFAVRAWWNEPSYTVIDKNGKKRTIQGGPAYFRPLKSVFEVAEWVSDPLMKFKNKLAPLISAAGQQLWPSKYQKEYKGWGDMPTRAKDFTLDAFQPIGVGKPIQVIQGKRDPKAAILPFLGFPTSKITEKKKKKTRSILSEISAF